MHELSNMGTIAHVIQLAIAPVFLLTAIGTLLTVTTNRLGRIIDRARNLEGKLESTPPEGIAKIHSQLANLSRRSKLIYLAITLSTTAALLVCAVIAILFLGDFFSFNITIPVAVLFIIAMLSLVLALLSFLREVFVATANLRIGPH
ncbi:DUF2721 domain-containing protein [Geobacter sp. AOG1]|uniref:DUF2721 domain-containing protein n=1 Tax=Geobacter sp. AOG1 TaxID=1566346 RepID=UPI001CC38804|nr:DUF2721 domain-containing protein [Geobacter sp. AOG1]GFE56954.1 hypothetical protein AOG1_08330 [Geobacter sp. AOG1]